MKKNKRLIKKDGFNWEALKKGPFWYVKRKMIIKGSIMIILCISSLGILIIPVFLYCGFRANNDNYKFIKEKGYYLFAKQDF